MLSNLKRQRGKGKKIKIQISGILLRQNQSQPNKLSGEEESNEELETQILILLDLVLELKLITEGPIWVVVYQQAGEVVEELKQEEVHNQLLVVKKIKKEGTISLGLYLRKRKRRLKLTPNSFILMELAQTQI